jgi:thiol-disulfide isomerase/thioredoxin
MNRVLVVIFGLIAAIGAGWLGYFLSGAGPTASPAAVPAVAGPGRAQPIDTVPAGAGQALAQLLGQAYPDVNGKPQALRQWSGKVLVVNFWATWCPPCREEMPGFSRLQSKLNGSGVQFVGIGVDDADKIQQYQKMAPVSYPLLVAGLETMSLTAALGNQTEGLPFTVFIGRGGQLHSIKVGRMSEEDVERRLKELM